MNLIFENLPMDEFAKAFVQTFWMVGISLSISILFGIPLGLLIYLTDKGIFIRNRIVHSVLNTIANVVRSVPFVILLVALLPLTQWITGTTIGPIAASVPLSVAAIPFLARLVESALREIPEGVLEASVATGASLTLIIREILIPEALPGIVAGITLTTVSLLGFSAMAGIVGGGGIGDLAIRFGYYRYEDGIMFATVAILVILVQLIQWTGDKIRRKTDKRAG
ncbi:methionine ABC transporter permease [Leptospira kmetyi]|uniref:ABC transporter permease n=1 Tax=Leptospira kmetyi TaxID=408139 RepID=A0A2M9XW32_9LEPT|nr:methionine ABC transporter permease [Leptospira kmetyi]AYV56779.1 ABC transporter permease [Leptospira kmetyi]EQA51953.1 ABC transporter, permease protein [Leptospira kmetyi serovar Malaysia str. Bejo-Iso9]PJZ31073.1 ABC transporter permease [Leptospira kmetyi]PJZ43551.1 ABC transporter permease [Leptospira kmetyi]TGK18347.1 ABC transporter permease [Leptospira kmetyi]